jgi:hypothetical protein
LFPGQWNLNTNRGPKVVYYIDEVIFQKIFFKFERTMDKKSHKNWLSCCGH